MSGGQFLAPPSEAARALGKLDLAVMQRSIDRLKERLDDATHEFMVCNTQVPTWWVALLATYARQVAEFLAMLEDVPDVKAAFVEMLGQFLDKAQQEDEIDG